MLGVPEPPSRRVQSHLGISWLWEFGPTLGGMVPPPYGNLSPRRFSHLEVIPRAPQLQGPALTGVFPVELQKQTEVERQKIVAECKELRAFLEEKEQLLLSRLEELERDIGRRRDESVARLAEDIAQLDKLLAEQGRDSGTGNTSGEVGLCYVCP